MSLLEYEKQIFLDAFHDDGLLITASFYRKIMAAYEKARESPITTNFGAGKVIKAAFSLLTTPLYKGLGLERIVGNFLKVYCDAANLVLVLNTTSLDEMDGCRITSSFSLCMDAGSLYSAVIPYHIQEYYIEKLENDNVSPLPKVVTNEYNASDRQSLYLQGGVLFITSRILVVDLLTDRVPVENITGIIVCRAHKIVESCQEAFILRLYRQKNKTGFIKAFSHTATAFTGGFCHVERTMKNLFVRHLFLWPRFHADVSNTLEEHKVDVVEIHVQLTDTMLACQAALLDIINACIKELKRCTTAIDADEITVENAISRSFDQTIRLQLDPIWHTLGPKVKQLVNDLKTLRLILRHLTQYDCVTFFNMVNSVRTSEKEFGKNTGWLLLESADNLFLHARNRIYGDDKKKKRIKTNKDEKVEKIPMLESCPKWEALQEVVDEITEHHRKCDTTILPQGRVLIAAEDDRTCSQIKEFLCDGSESLLARIYNRSLAMKGEYLEENKKKPKQKRSKVTKAAEPELTLTQMVAKGDGDSEQQKDGLCTSEDVYYSQLVDPVTIIHPLHGASDPFSLVRTLHEVQPTYVVLYDPDMEFVRQLEVYRASEPGRPLRVYFLMYTGSTEEQRYLTALRKEKEAFEYLIHEKSTMVIPEEREGKMENDPNLSRDITPANATTNTRKGGQSSANIQQKVIVDVREFRSELPSLIHRRGIDIEPVTLEVGDYILTPDICVERKSVSDLIGSLNNGRLYNQCVSMCRFYKRPVLLIEFDANKSFSLQGKFPMSSDVSIQETTSRLTLLTMHFPKLRILWCQSPYATAELVQELKAGRDEPDASVAMTVTASDDSIEWSDRYSHAPQDMLLRMPGVNSKNYRNIMGKVSDLAELASLSEEELTKIMGSSQNAKHLHNFLYTEHKPSDSAVSNKPGTSNTGKTDYSNRWNKRKR